MGKLLFLVLFVLNSMAQDLSIEKAKRLIFEEVYRIHRCDEPKYYTKEVCIGDYLQDITYNYELKGYEVSFEYEYGQMLHAIVFEDEAVDVSYWSTF